MSTNTKQQRGNPAATLRPEVKPLMQALVEALMTGNMPAVGELRRQLLELGVMVEIGGSMPGNSNIFGEPGTFTSALEDLINLFNQRPSNGSGNHQAKPEAKDGASTRQVTSRAGHEVIHEAAELISALDEFNIQMVETRGLLVQLNVALHGLVKEIKGKTGRDINPGILVYSQKLIGRSEGVNASHVTTLVDGVFLIHRYVNSSGNDDYRCRPAVLTYGYRDPYERNNTGSFNLDKLPLEPKGQSDVRSLLDFHEALKRTVRFLPAILADATRKCLLPAE